jgi:HSP20 family molecular chaperone IbpA
MVWRPAIELWREDDGYIARALVPGVEAKDLEVWVAPDVLLIKGETMRGEYGHTKLLSSIKFPRPVNPNDIVAEVKEGMLSVRAALAGVVRMDRQLLKAA